MEDSNFTEPEEPGLEINDRMLHYLDVVRKWAMFLSIIGFILIGFLVFAGFSMGLFMQYADQPLVTGVPSMLIGLIYLVFAIIYFFPVLYLYRFAKSAKIGIEHRDIEWIEDAFKNLKTHYLLFGVFTIVGICFYFLAMFFVVVSMMVGK